MMNGYDIGLSGVPIKTMSLHEGYRKSLVLTDGKSFLDEWNRQRAERDNDDKSS